jgi:hypothetical protein
MIENKKEFMLGFGMMVLFFVVLGIMFSPVFEGKNGMQYLDALYNSISKGSAYYIPKSKDEAAVTLGKQISVKFNGADDKLKIDKDLQVKMIVDQLQKAGFQAAVDEKDSKKVKMDADLGALLLKSLEDADLMYHNDGGTISGKYGIDERQAMFNWARILKGTVKDLNKQEKFDEGTIVGEVMSKSIETSYNYYKIVPKNIGSCWWIVAGSLIFYVIYTMWYGYAILFMFEGWGMKFGH